MRRCAVIGASGSGKSTHAGRIAQVLDVECIDLDELFHGPDWSLPETPELRRRVTEALDRADADRAGWVVSGNYSTTADIVHGRADTIVWLDLPRWRSTARVVRR
ncbi:MAG: adenylate kinase, partial [Actinomycetota bacterium]